MSKKINKKNPLWGGRFEGSTDSLTQSFSASIDVDKELYAVDIKGSIAYAEALKEAKVITPKEFQKIKRGLIKILAEIEDEKFEWNESLEDVHMNIETALVRKAGNSKPFILFTFVNGLTFSTVLLSKIGYLGLLKVNT